MQNNQESRSNMEIKNKLKDRFPKNRIAMFGVVALSCLGLVYFGDRVEPIERDRTDEIADEDNLNIYVENCDQQAQDAVLKRINDVISLIEDSQRPITDETIGNDVNVERAEGPNLYKITLRECLQIKLDEFTTNTLAANKYSPQFFNPEE